MTSAATALLDPARLAQPSTLVRSEPFPFLIARDQLPEGHAAALVADFPKYSGAGFFPHETRDCGPSINALVEALSGSPFANAIGRALGIETLSRYPTLVTLCRSLNSRHGNVHTDSDSKVVTALVYLMPTWPEHEHGGCLRFVADQNNIASLVAPELKPIYGNLAAFKRTTRSWHGHLPFEGERRVIQCAWLTSDAEKARKTRRGRTSRLIKWIAGKLDRDVGRRG